MLPLVSAHVTHRWVDIERLELVAAKEAKSLLAAVMTFPGVREAAILKTCNRVEVYAAVEGHEARKSLEPIAADFLPQELEGTVRFLAGVETIHHLFRVASGIDSMIVGEDQILGQVKEALGFARTEGSLGPTIDRLFRKAIAVGKRVRTETTVNEGSVSIGSAAVDLAVKLLGDLTGKVVLVLGAGETATLVAKALARWKLKAIFVANRSHERAEELARELNGIAISFEEMPKYIPVSDVIIGATGAPHVVLSKDELADMLARASRVDPLLIIDISIPRTIDDRVAEIRGVELRNLDGLHEIARENLDRRKAEVLAAERIVDEELAAFLEKADEAPAEALAKRLYTKVRALREGEFQEFLNKVETLNAEQRDAVRAMLDSFANRMLAGPTLALKRAAREGDVASLRIAARLFGLEEE
ncbi:MAG TPA: glutamyl-tRNA reductase [Thermoplasmata archaeon]|nr:glutamyl-tRNA reductase [Thermoplasmata archaeon]